MNFKALNARLSSDPKASAKLLNSEAKAVKLKQAAAAKNTNERVAIKTVHHQQLQVQQTEAFGKSTRPGTPVRDLINNKFGNEGERETALRYDQYYSERVQGCQAHTTIKNTRASLGRSERVKAQSVQPEREPFKLSKFKKTKSRIKQIWSATVHPPTETAH